MAGLSETENYKPKLLASRDNKVGILDISSLLNLQLGVLATT